MDGEVFPWHHSRYKKEVRWRGYMWHQGLTLTCLTGLTSKINLGLFTEIRQDANEQRSRRDKRRATNTALKKNTTFLCKWPKPKTTCGKNKKPSKTQETLPTHLSIQICRTRCSTNFINHTCKSGFSWLRKMWGRRSAWDWLSATPAFWVFALETAGCLMCEIWYDADVLTCGLRR